MNEAPRCPRCGGHMGRWALSVFGCQACNTTVPALPGDVEKKAPDPVNPSHYVKRGIEVRHVIRAFECTYNVGTAVAYLLRAQFKKDYIEDLRKAAKHIQFELEDKFRPGDTAIDKGGGGDGVDRDRTK